MLNGRTISNYVSLASSTRSMLGQFAVKSIVVIFVRSGVPVHHKFFKKVRVAQVAGEALCQVCFGKGSLALQCL